jgi:hypothetical protein
MKSNKINVNQVEFEKNTFLNLELSYIFKIFNSQIAYTEVEKNFNEGNGVYSSEEWFNTRKKNNFFTEPNDLNYRILQYLNYSKFNSAIHLCKKFNFSNFSKLGEIGGVPFHQSMLIHDLNPHLKFLLTDYDYNSCKTMKSFPKFSNLDIQKFDAKNDSYTVFDDCDILTMWGVDSLLNDADLYRLFIYIKNSKKTLLIASRDINFGLFLPYQIHKTIKFPLRLIKNFIKILLGRYKQLRNTGILRNENYFRKLSKRIGVKIETIQVDDPKNYRILKITY